MRRTASRDDSRSDIPAGEGGVRQDVRPLAGRSPSPGPRGPEPDDGDPRRALRLLGWAVVAVIAVVAVRVLLVQSFVVPSGSMEPTLRPGDRVVVTRGIAFGGTVHRGDVVVFDGRGVFEPDVEPAASPLAAAGRAVAAALGAPVGASDYVKRVVGLPEDHVVCCDASGRITVNGVPLAEPYLAPGVRPSEDPFDVVVPPGRLFVLGDNRTASGDSRAHLGDPGGGTVPTDRLVGTVVGVWWPFDRVGGLS